MERAVTDDVGPSDAPFAAGSTGSTASSGRAATGDARSIRHDRSDAGAERLAPLGAVSATSDRRASGFDETFPQIVEQHSAAVFRLAQSVVRDPALADDVTQETFIKVWKHLDDFRGESSLRGWILRIAHNTAVSTLRKIRDSATDPSKLPDAHDPIPTTRVVEGRLAADELVDALNDLDDLSREVVVLREVEGMAYEEIATTLTISVPMVKTRLLRARRRLSVTLEGWRS